MEVEFHKVGVVYHKEEDGEVCREVRHVPGWLSPASRRC